MSIVKGRIHTDEILRDLAKKFCQVRILEEHMVTEMFNCYQERRTGTSFARLLAAVEKKAGVYQTERAFKKRIKRERRDTPDDVIQEIRYRFWMLIRVLVLPAGQPVTKRLLNAYCGIRGWQIRGMVRRNNLEQLKVATESVVCPHDADQDGIRPFAEVAVSQQLNSDIGLDLEWAWQRLDSLPLDQRAVLQCRLNGLTPTEIAKELHLTVSQIVYKLNLAMTLLRQEK